MGPLNATSDLGLPTRLWKPRLQCHRVQGPGARKTKRTLQWKIGKPTVENRENREIGKILLFFALFLSKWADNRSIRWIKSKISSWSFYFFRMFFQKHHFCQNRRFWDHQKCQKRYKKVQRPHNRFFSEGGG